MCTQEFKLNFNFNSRRGRILGVCTESHTYCMHCMLTTIKLYACCAVKLYKNKPKNISNGGGGIKQICSDVFINGIYFGGEYQLLTLSKSLDFIIRLKDVNISKH